MTREAVEQEVCFGTWEGDSGTFSEWFFKSASSRSLSTLHLLLLSISHGTRPETGGHWETGEQSGISNQAIRYSHPHQQRN